MIGAAVRPERFDPKRDGRVFRIAASDYETSLFSPLLLSSGLVVSRIIFRSLVRHGAIEALHVGDIDLLLGYTWDRGKSCDTVTLFHEDYVVVARQGRPVFAEPLDVDRYTRFGHVLVSPGASLTGIVDKALAGLGASRQVVMAVPYFFAALATVARTDLIETPPRRVAHCHAATFGLTMALPPVPVRSFPVQMVWSRRLGADPALSWLRERVEELTKGLT